MGTTARARWVEVLTVEREGGGHLVQLYETEGFLAESVGHCVGASLRRGQAGLLVATPEHARHFLAALAAHGLAVDAALAEGRLVLLDAGALLAQLLVDGRPDRARFEAIVAPLVRRLRERHGGLAAYGEMVQLLCDRDDYAGAQRLEELWCELGSTQPFVLLCGYAGGAFRAAHEAFVGVCQTHGVVLPSEAFIGLESAEAELRAVAELEVARSRLEREVAERRDAEARMRDSEALTKGIVSSSRDCIKVLDLEGRLLFMNDGGLEILEICDFAPLIGSVWFDFWGPADRLSAIAAFEEARAGRAGEFVGFFATARTRTPKWWHVVVSPIAASGGRVERVLAVSRDVTDRRRLEGELRKAIELRDDFLSIASHELRTPITALQMQIELVRRKVDAAAGVAPPPARLERALDISLKQVHRVTALISAMLDVARLQLGPLAVAPEPCDLSEIVRAVFERYHDQFAAAGCPITLSLTDEATGVWDRSRIEQVAENLASNALKYAGGAAVEVVTDVVDGVARLVVRDHGAGVPTDKQAIIFDRFERAVGPSAASGLGLGLFIAREIVSAHKGRIFCETPGGGGTRFVVELPIAAAEADPVQATA